MFVKCKYKNTVPLIFGVKVRVSGGAKEGMDFRWRQMHGKAQGKQLVPGRGAFPGEYLVCVCTGQSGSFYALAFFQIFFGQQFFQGNEKRFLGTTSGKFDR